MIVTRSPTNAIPSLLGSGALDTHPAVERELTTSLTSSRPIHPPARRGRPLPREWGYGVQRAYGPQVGLLTEVQQRFTVCVKSRSRGKEDVASSIPSHGASALRFHAMSFSVGHARCSKSFGGVVRSIPRGRRRLPNGRQCREKPHSRGHPPWLVAHVGV